MCLTYQCVGYKGHSFEQADGNIGQKVFSEKMLEKAAGFYSV